jgi:porin
MMKTLTLLAWALALSGAAEMANAEAASPPKAISFVGTATTDLWQNTSGGVKHGGVVINTVDAIFDFDGAAFGHEDWSANLHVLASDGHSLGALLGDVQTATNIEGDGATHLFEAWVRRQITPTTAIKVGIIDLNADFDAHETPGLFINSSHGVGPELSGAGPNGAPVWPNGTAGIELQMTPTQNSRFTAALFNGSPRDVDHPLALAAVTLHKGDGVMAIAQGDWTSANGVHWSAALWHHTADFSPLDPLATKPVSGQTGAYGLIEAPLPFLAKSSSWIRVARVDDASSYVSTYVGGGVTQDGLFSARPDDKTGLAFAYAGISDKARSASALGGLPLKSGELVFELTYAAQITPTLALQPDLQYIVHPGGDSSLSDALVIGLRISLQTY